MSALVVFLDGEETCETALDVIAAALQAQRRATDQIAYYDVAAQPGAVVLYPVAGAHRLTNILSDVAAARSAPMLLIDAARDDALALWAYHSGGMARASWPLRHAQSEQDWAHLCAALRVDLFAPDEHVLLAYEVLAAFSARAGLAYAALVRGARGAQSDGLPKIGDTGAEPDNSPVVGGLFGRGTVQTAHASEARFALDIERSGALGVVHVKVTGATLGALYVEQAGEQTRVEGENGQYATNFSVVAKSPLDRALRTRSSDVLLGIELVAPHAVRARLASVQFHCGTPRAPGAPGLVLDIVAEPERLHAPSDPATIQTGK